MKKIIILIFWMGLCLDVCAHGRSAEMIRELDAPVPDWMSVAEPIKVEPIQDQSVTESYSFRPRSGGASNSRNRVHILERGIEFQVPYEIDWRGVNEEGYGVSLNADGTKLLVNAGMTAHLYRIASNGEHQEIPLQLPCVTYDEGSKGFITGWSWAAKDLLIGRAEISDEAEHEINEGRLYVYYMKEQALARLDLSTLNLPDTAGIEFASIGGDLEHLRIRLGDRDIVVKADLKSPPRLLIHSDSTSTSSRQAIEQTQEPNKTSNNQFAPSTPRSKQSSQTWWLVVTVVVLTAIGLLWLLQKMRK